MRTNSNRNTARIIPVLLFPLLFVAGVAVGVGQYRRVTNDVQHNIDRFRSVLAPLTNRGFESLVFAEIPGRSDLMPQARVVMAPCVLLASSKAKQVRDTILSIRPKDAPLQHAGHFEIWHTEDESYSYSLLVPPPK